ncbi:MAG: hypothetical protein DMF62_00495 [Acidobacteria bacterium]|nr:MAG: hypothetical protein DMF62_00495 [Acidobacteriota bacterium]
MIPSSVTDAAAIVLGSFLFLVVVLQLKLIQERTKDDNHFLEVGREKRGEQEGYQLYGALRRDKLK